MPEAEVKRINCKSCSAPLELHGGHKVETLTCSYCGSVLDAHEDYKILARHNEEAGKRSYLPLQLGMAGRLKEVEFTVIGLLSYRADGDVWTEFCLFSPTHGYVWLSWSDGHFVFIRRERDLPYPSQRWNLNPKAKVRMGGRFFRFFERYEAEVIDVAGELPWRAEVDDKVAMAEAIDPPYILSQEVEGGFEWRTWNEDSDETEDSESPTKELEYYLGEYLDHNEVAEGFGIELKKPVGVHPAMPFRTNPLSQAMGFNGRIFAALAFITMVVLIAMGGGSKVHQQNFPWQQISSPEGAISQPFQVSNTDRLVEAELYSGVNNAWMWLEVSLLKDNERLFTTGKEISYYHGSEGGESWSEGSHSGILRFKVPEPGNYRLQFNAEGGGSRFQRNLSITVTEGVLLKRWFVFLLLLMIVAALWPVIRRWLFEQSRWAPVVGDD